MGGQPDDRGQRLALGRGLRPVNLGPQAAEIEALAVWARALTSAEVAELLTLRMRGVDVPGQLSVVGYDDTRLASLDNVELTSVSQEPRALAAATVLVRNHPRRGPIAVGERIRYPAAALGEAEFGSASELSALPRDVRWPRSSARGRSRPLGSHLGETFTNLRQFARPL
ncbi:substrate-binding domain-containing protein [Amycolatopsis sp. 195334CR]|nr:substrate-binding domain-containing protein [Amycolatopsis sp. 195334CR]